MFLGRCGFVLTRVGWSQWRTHQIGCAGILLWRLITVREYSFQIWCGNGWETKVLNWWQCQILSIFSIEMVPFVTDRQCFHSSSLSSWNSLKYWITSSVSDLTLFSTSVIWLWYLVNCLLVARFCFWNNCSYSRTVDSKLVMCVYRIMTASVTYFSCPFLPAGSSVDHLCFWVVPVDYTTGKYRF